MNIVLHIKFCSCLKMFINKEETGAVKLMF